MVNIFHKYIYFEIVDNNCTFDFLFMDLFSSLIVVSASPGCYDSYCEPNKRYCLYEGPHKVVLPKLGFGGLYHCKC